MQQPRRASATSAPLSAPSTRISSNPRPMVTTSFDNYMPNSPSDTPASAMASTPEALSFYGQRRQQGSSNAFSPTGASALAERNVDRLSQRSASGPVLNASRSSPTFAGPERLQRASIKDLVAKFNQNSDGNTFQGSPQHANPQQGNPPQLHTYIRKPAPATSAGAQERSQAQHSRPRQQISQDSMTRKTRRSPVRQYTSRDTSHNLDARPSETAGGLSLTRPRTADNVNVPAEQSRPPLFGEVVAGAGSEWVNPGHGILNTKQRRLSEGSMHYPNPMFPNGRTSYIEETSVASEPVDALAVPKGLNSTAVTHGRSRSDSSGGQHLTSHPRLPIQTSRIENGPEPLHYPTHESTPRQPTTPPPLYNKAPNQAVGSGQRLNAIITAPAPTISPPLRSSRPRQDITTARPVSPTPPGRDVTPSLVGSPERTKLFAGVNMDLASRRNSIRKTLRQDRERSLQASQTSPKFFSRPPGSAPSLNPSPTTRRPLPQNSDATSTHAPQLSGAVYTQPTPALKIKVPRVQGQASDEPGSGATQFEEDDSPTLGVSGGFSNDRNALIDEQSQDQILEPRTRDSRDPIGNSSEPDRKTSRTVLSQIMEMRRSDASQFVSTSRPSMAASSTGDQDDAGTIQIMLSDTPALNRLSAGWQSRELNYGSNQGINGSENTAQDYVTVQDESISSTPSMRTGTSQNERESSSTTLDRDPYHLIHRILDQYRESGAVSTEMIHDFQQIILDTDPDLSGRDEMESMNIAKAALEDIIKDHSGSAVSTSPPSTSDINSSTQIGEDRPYWESIGSDTTIMNTGHSNQQDTSSISDDSGRPVPPPKDLRIPAPPFQDGLSRGTRVDDGTVLDEASLAESRPTLPEMPSTGGNLGLVLGNISMNGSPANANKAQAEIPQSRSTLSDQFESIPDNGTPLSSQSAASQQRIPRLAPSQHMNSGIGGDHSQLSESHSRGPSFERDSQPRSSPAFHATEQRRLTQRRHLIKELVDTEYSFNQDMKVIEDIYKGTASSVTALTQEDQRVLFGNSAQVVEFSESFLDALKQASRSVYKVPRGSQWRVNPSNLSEPNSGSQTEESSLASSEATDDERDRKTFIGDAFNNHMSRMEKVYSEYLKNHDFANQRLQKLQTIAQVQLWLSECHAYANDITSAWDLDSLLVKPVQRILKYPLLLRSLLEQTPDDHPDHTALEFAVKQSEDVSYRINESKKRAELLEQVVNKTPKRKDFDFSKVFSRRTDKIAHRVGLSEAVEDPDYKRLAEKFGGRYFQLQIVMRDIEMYKKKTEDFMTQFNRCISAIEDFIDVGHSNSPEIESKWRKFAMTIREMTAIAYADHDNAVRRHCVDPILTLIKLHDGPQRLMQKRKKRIVEYAKFLTVKNRGDRVDRKLQEQGDQFVALNDTLKDELPKLFNLTAKLVEACLRNFIDLQSQWHTTWQRKIKYVLDDQQIPQSWADIVEAFNSDFSYTEAHVLSLGICNGSLLAETSNFLSSASSFTMTDDNSSIKRPSLSAQKTSPSLGQPEFKRSSEGSMGLPFSSPRTSSDSQVQQARSNGYSQYQPRYRADSNLSTHSNNAWNQSSMASPRGPPTYNPAAYTNDSHQAFRYRRSTEASATPLQPTTSYPSNTANPAPMTRQASNPGRSVSSSTFYTASSVTASQRESSDSSEPRYSGLFSSAMPMSDSPDDTRGYPHPSASGEQTQPTILFTAASMFAFALDRCRKEAGYPYLNYAAGEIFNVIGEKGELWLASNQDDPTHSIGWIWEKHFAKLVH